MRYAKCLSVLHQMIGKKKVLKGLESAAGFFISGSSRLQIRYSPEIIFEIDDSIEYGAKISKIIRDIKEKEK